MLCHTMDVEGKGGDPVAAAQGQLLRDHNHRIIELEKGLMQLATTNLLGLLNLYLPNLIAPASHVLTCTSATSYNVKLFLTSLGI